jgi:AAA+ ATPase superfamily predicted ATPase
MIEIGAHQQLKKVIDRDYDTFTGIMLEKYFKTKVMETEAFTNIGGYWDRKGEIEIDFIAVNELEKKIIVAEIKRNKQKIRLSALQLKMGQLLALYPKNSESLKKIYDSVHTDTITETKEKNEITGN